MLALVVSICALALAVATLIAQRRAADSLRQARESIEACTRLLDAQEAGARGDKPKVPANVMVRMGLSGHDIGAERRASTGWRCPPPRMSRIDLA